MKGWKDVSDLTVEEAFARVVERGLREIIYTDIATDGMLAGPNIQAYEHILEFFPGVSLIASGGVSSVEDLAALSRLSGVRGAITGKAVYDGRIDLAQAFQTVQVISLHWRCRLWIWMSPGLLKWSATSASSMI